MPSSIRNITLLALMGIASAVPSGIRLTPRQQWYHTLAERAQKADANAGLTDLDILQL